MRANAFFNRPLDRRKNAKTGLETLEFETCKGCIGVVGCRLVTVCKHSIDSFRVGIRLLTPEEKARRTAQARSDQIRDCTKPGREALGLAGRVGMNRQAERLGFSSNPNAKKVPWAADLCGEYGVKESETAFCIPAVETHYIPAKP